MFTPERQRLTRGSPMRGRSTETVRRLLRGAIRSHPEVPANLIGAAVVYFYFNYVDPLEPALDRTQVQRFGTFVVVTITIVLANFLLATRWMWPLDDWEQRLRAGGDPTTVPSNVRRRALNAPLMSSVVTMAGWVIAGAFYFVFLSWWVGLSLAESTRAFAGLVLVAGPFTSSLVFLATEFHWRRQIPVFFPDGRIDRVGVLRVPVRVRLAATFMVTSLLPRLGRVMMDAGFERRFGVGMPPPIRHVWIGLMQTQTFVVVATGFACMVMAALVARFINRPVQALRTAMARVAA